MHRNSILLFERYALPIIAPGAKVLEVGAPWGKSAYREKLNGVDYHFADTRNKGADLPGYVQMSGPYDFACARDFDAVISGQTIEHVARPWAWMPALSLLLKSGGHLVVICPVTWAEHRHPIDAWRILPDGMRELLEWANLEPVHVGMESLDETGTDHRYQFNAGPVRDCIGIGRKR